MTNAQTFSIVSAAFRVTATKIEGKNGTLLVVIGTIKGLFPPLFPPVALSPNAPSSPPAASAARRWMPYSAHPTRWLPNTPAPAMDRMKDGPALLQYSSSASACRREIVPARYSSPTVRPPTG